MATSSMPLHDREKRADILMRFTQEFSFKLAETQAEKERIYRLRYDVYCEELKYEAPTDAVRKMEFDDYDQNSIHCLVEHKRTGRPAGCLRLVFPDPDGPPPVNRLPMEAYGGKSLTHPFLHPEKLPKESYFEISRLALMKEFRSRKSAAEVPGISDCESLFSQEERQTFPILVSSLFLTGFILGMLAGKTQVFAMMEPRLPRLLALSGFHFTKVGETIDFHGQRSAYYISREQAEKGMHEREDLIPLYTHLRSELAPQLKRVLPDLSLASVC